MTMYQSEPHYETSNYQKQKARLPVLANAPFYLTHHPIAWDLVVDGKKVYWLPQLSKLNEIPGVNGVQSVRGGGVDSTHAKARAMENGKTILPWSLGYLTKYPARGGNYYCIKWSQPKSIGNNVINKLDEKGWNEFRKQLIVDGYIQPMDPDLIPIFVQQQEQIIERLYKDQHLPEIKKRLEAIQKKITNMQKATIVQVAS